MKLDAAGKSAKELNQMIKNCQDNDITIINVLGQRYLANATKDKRLNIYGTCGNNLGSFLAGSQIHVYGNVQEACADTMDDGEIIVHGSGGDACGYGMRGGKLYIEKNCGSRLGIHMKAYQKKQPVIVIGGCTKDFLGEYLAGGTIIVLNLANEAHCVGKYCGSGAHGGAIYLRLAKHEKLPYTPNQLCAVSEEEQQNIDTILADYAQKLNITLPTDMQFCRIVIQDKNPYEGLYVDY